MSAEITMTQSLQVVKGNVNLSWLPASGATVTMTGTRTSRIQQSIGFAAEEALQLGELSGALGYVMFKNLDATNYVEILTGTGGVKFCKLLAGETAGPFRLGSQVTAPYAQANTAAVLLDMWFVEA